MGSPSSIVPLRREREDGPTELQPLLLRPTEVAKLLSIGRTTVHELVAAGELPCKRIGRAIRIPREAVERFAQSDN